ncbi:SNF1-interacting protein [Parahypoxylon ruwenzoriense]
MATATTTPALPTPTPPSAKHPSPSIPVILNEAGLDSPSFRATAVYFAEQVDAIERWLEGYARTTAKLSHDMLGLEDTINHYLAKSIPPPNINAVDHDYTALALKRISDGSREWWMQILYMARKMDSMSVEPIRNFLSGDLRNFKETRKTLEQTQKVFDTTLARYVGQSKTKEPSSLREDAFAVYETRKAYLKASMDFCFFAPQFRLNLDKLLVRVSCDLWREMKRSRDAAGSFGKYGHEMDRVRGWTKEMELSEPTFKRELQTARRDIGETTLAAFKPSREIDDYSASTVPFLGSRGPMHVTTPGKSAAIMEKQGWLFLRTITGKPSRTNWIRRWYYCRDGIFGWLVNSPQGVLQGDEIGVLLCNAKPVVGEERRFCFEVKTKNQTLLLQAETQSQLMEWLEVFEVAKKKAFEASVSRDSSSLPGGVDPAFSITPPSLPEFSAKTLDAQIDDGLAGAERSGTLPAPGTEASLVPRPSFDLTTAPPKRSVTSLAREEGESSREHAARIMQKLDLHRKATFTSSMDMGPMPSPAPTGGIASLISASHGLLQGYPTAPKQQQGPALPGPETQPGSLAPPTLAKPPATTNLSKTAVVYSSDRVFTANPTQSLPTAIMANYWGSNTWGQEYSSKTTLPNPDLEDPFGPNSPSIKMTIGDGEEAKSPSSAHKKAISMDARIMHPKIVTPAPEKPPQETFPADYPVELKTNSAQFRLLFPGVPLDEKLVLVFRASWNSTSEADRDAPQMAGNGRVYVTSDNMYFYGHQMGLVVTYTISLDTITEVTAAPGRDCDFIFLHLNQGADDIGYTRITIKTFLEDLDLLHARLNLLVDDLQAEEPMELPEIINALINLENEEYDKRSPSMDSWEEVSAHTPIDDRTATGRTVTPRHHDSAYRSRNKIPRKPLPKFQLPAHPVIYEPEGMQRKVTERNFEISAKACFHVLFGDKSFVFPKLYFERRAQHIAQGPWKLNDSGNLQRQFRFKVNYTTRLGRPRAEEVTDEQTIELFSDHVTYVVTHVKTPWHLPHAHGFKLVTKIVITHVAKSKCKLAIFTKVAWSKPPALAKNMVERQALDDAGQDAEELAEVATDQVRKLGHQSRTKRAIQVYGNVGQQTQVLVFTPGENDTSKKAHINPRTLSSMLLETIRSFGDSVASSLVMWAFAGVKKLWDVVTAQWIILALLGFSVLTNIIFSSQGTSAWWGERRAANFMNRIGVGPNVVMSKAIYIADLGEAARSSTALPSWPQDSYCYSTFQSIANSSDVDAPYEYAGSSLSWSSSRATARRLRQTRQKLGTYRHDLIVAMRMVNSVEREMLHAEWENWLLDENYRCEQVEAVLEAWNSSSPPGSGARGDVPRDSGLRQQILQNGGKDDVKRKNLQLWHEEYCGSCKADREALLRERENLSLLTAVL